ncbi:MAG: M60 family metallopeptidase, partial [Muribaculaceae bacterium]|nr:M60 family metallopeptidase [Muribaculaceae bacterium]
MKKVFSLRRIAAATVMLLPMLGITAMAALPQAGKAYRFTNVAYSNVLTSNGPGSNATCNKPDTESTAQEWVISKGPTNNTYYLRSLITGLYLCSPDRTSNPWYMSSTTTDAALSIVESDGHLTIRKAGSSNSFGYLHNDAAGQAVCWDATQNTSWWTANALSYTDAEIDAAIKRAEENAAVVNNESKYQTALNAIFDDKACTVLKSKYASMTDAQLAADANYKALAPELQAMIKKVKTGDWSETDIKTKLKWDSTHAKKFRVQNYEPYSRAVEVQPLTGIQYYTNMNNPTGITTKAYNTLYVMVDKAPADGSTIYINGALGSAMFNEWNRGTQLHEGLNIIPVWNDDALQYIYYTADTYSNGKRAHKLSEFPDVKIHIEGGSLNGFYDYLGDDLYTPDTNEDWFYYRDRASHTMFDLVGKYVILHFFFDKVYNNGPNTGSLVEGLKGILTSTDSRVDLPKIMEAWDDMCFSEHLIMGLRSNDDIRSARAKGYYAPLEDGDKAPNDLHEYFNNRMMGITMQGDLYMNATNWRTAYAPYTVSDILLNFRTSSGCIWGPAHEYGHMNQTPMKLVGTTEISNNVFSNVAVFYQGIDCSRADYASTQREIFNKGGIFLDHGLWGATRMFFQLWLYYHQVGHNRKFYPTLYQLLRENPLQHPYEYNERYDKLHFAKMCCIAAGEDLTDFFESWGFFIPIDHLAIEDYANNIANLTVEDIEAVKAEIAALKLPKNYAILNIDDRPGSTRGDYGGEWHKSKAGALGGLKDFADNVKAESGLLYTISGRDITVSGGKGGVGFVGYSVDGKLITFANDYSWTLNDKAAEALATGTGKLYAVSGDNTRVAVKLAATDGSAAQKTSAANAMISAAKAMIDRVDPNEAIVGWFRASLLATLQK